MSEQSTSFQDNTQNDVKVEIVKNWLEKNGFGNIVWTSDNKYVKADAPSSSCNMLVVFYDGTELKDLPEKDANTLRLFGYRNRRRVWMAKIDPTNIEIEWSELN